MLGVLIAILLVNAPKQRINIYNLILPVAIIGLFIISIFFNGEYASRYLLFFLVFGIPAFLISGFDIDYDYLYKALERFFLVYLLVYLLFERSIFLSSNDYWVAQMGKAYSFVPIILVSMAKLYLYREKLFISIANILLASYFIIFDCATRGAILSVALSIILFIYLLLDKRIRRVYLISILAIIVLIIVNLVSLLQSVQGMLDLSGNSISAIDKSLMMLSQEDDMSNGRNELYSTAIDLFKKSPVFGWGIGGFEHFNMAPDYPHQLFLQILCEMGLIGLIAMMLLLKGGVKKVFMRSERLTKDRAFLFILFMSVIPTLMFSSSYWLLPSFWLLVAMGARKDVCESAYVI